LEYGAERFPSLIDDQGDPRLPLLLHRDGRNKRDRAEPGTFSIAAETGLGSPEVSTDAMSTILFDLDGVVFEKNIFERRLKSEHNISPDMTAPFFKGPFVRCQLGKADLKSEVARFLPTWGWRGTVDDFLTFWFNCDQCETRGILSLVAELSSQGHRCHLATNQEKYRSEFLRQNRSLSVFGQMFCSYEVGGRKPEADFFAEVERRLGEKPNDLFFWDDAPENVVGAQERGWTAYLFTDVPTIRRQLASHFRVLE
jgi:putative hydrolase of the HAD superfamily